MTKNELLKEIDKTKSLKEAYDLCVAKAGLKMGYDEFSSKVRNNILKEGALSDAELELINGGSWSSFWKGAGNIFSKYIEPIIDIGMAFGEVVAGGVEIAFTGGAATPIVIADVASGIESIGEAVEKIKTW